jgi:arabinan endo-1,5-alpha-L-arabinosidase
MLRLLLISALIVLVFAYTNPVQGARDSPDPGVLYHAGAYYAVTTGGWDNHAFPIWKSDTGVNFTQAGWVFPTHPTWTQCCDYWAPELHIINQKFLVYFTARDSNGKLSIGSAIADNILGPYVDKGSPLVTNASEGVIDATVLRQGVNNYLVYKVDGNAHGHPTEFWAVLLDPTGMSTRGNPQLLLKNDQAW